MGLTPPRSALLSGRRLKKTLVAQAVCPYSDGSEVALMLSQYELIGVIPTSDPVAARRFYEGLLRLKFIEDDGFALVFAGHHCTLRIVKMPEFRPASLTLLGWEVPEIEDEVRELIASGVGFERYGYFTQDALGIWTAPNGSKVAWFKDPDGNVLSLSQHKY